MSSGATRLEQLRVDAGLSPEQLGEIVGVTGVTIRRIEQGKPAYASTHKKIADHFELRVTDLWPIEDRAA